MRLKIITAAIAPLLISAMAFAQGERAPQPAPELKKLDYFAGAWNTETELKPGPMGPGGKYTSVDTYEWQKGKFFVIGHVDFKSPIGDGTEMSVMGYDPAKKLYTYDAFNSSGERQAATGVLEGDTWTWTGSTPFKWRYIEKVLSPTSFAIQFQMSPDGAAWNTIMEGKSNKQ